MRRLVFQLIGRVIVVAEKLRVLGAQLRRANHDIARIELAAFAVARKRGLHDLLAQRAILQRPEHRLAGRVLEPDNELAFLVLVFRGRGRARDLVVGKTGEIFFRYRPQPTTRFFPSGRFVRTASAAWRVRH